MLPAHKLLYWGLGYPRVDSLEISGAIERVVLNGLRSFKRGYATVRMMDGERLPHVLIRTHFLEDGNLRAWLDCLSSVSRERRLCRAILVWLSIEFGFDLRGNVTKPLSTLSDYRGWNF